MRFFRRILLCLLAVLLPLSALGAPLHEELPCATLQVEAAIGYGGLMTYGKLMPLRIRLENLGSDMNATLAVNVYIHQAQYNRYEMEVPLAAAAVKELCIPVYVGSKQETFTVEVWESGSKVCAVNAHPARVLDPASMLVGVLSPAPEKLSYMNIDSTTDDLLRGEFMQTVPLTAETFPETAELLSAFGMLVVDSFDVSLLSEDQRQALDAWLEEGHILLLGGGAQAGTAWPYFSSLTGLTPGGLASADVTPGLLQWLGITGLPAGKPVDIVQAGGTPLATASDGTGLLWYTVAGNSRIYTAAFSLADSVLAGWTPMHTFWQRALVDDCYSLYQHCLYPNINNVSYAHVAFNLPLENDVPLLPAALAAAAVLVLGSLGAYLLLRRADKRQWLWAVLHALAAVCAGMVCTMAAGSSAAQPTALSVSVLQQDAAGIAELITSSALSGPEGGEHVITSESGSVRALDEFSYYDYDSNAPLTLNYRYLLGEKASLGVSLERPWDLQYFQVSDAPLPQGSVEASAWMEQDGLHVSLVNGTQLTLDEGVFACKYGFSSVPALAPGEGCTLTLVKTAGDPNDPYRYKDGCMYESLGGSYFSPYAVLSRYYLQRENPDGQPDYILSSDANRMIDLMIQVINQREQSYSAVYSHTYTPAPSFYYLATSAQLQVPQILLDGQAITRTASMGLVAVDVPFTAQQGRQVYLLPGECQPVRCQVDAQGVPYCSAPQATAAAAYHRLREQPVFMFQPGAALDTITRLAFYVDYLPRNAQAFLYNGTDWVAITAGEEISSPQQFIDGQGRIFLQFRLDAVGDDYHEIATPAMLLEGRTK